jgi:hypothetical protein
MTRQAIRCILFLLVTIGVTSCSAPKAGDPGYVEWVIDYSNNMHVRHTQNDLVFDLQFHPAEFAWMQRNGSFDSKAFEADQAEFDQMQYFVLNIHSVNGKGDLIERLANGNQQLAGELLYYFSYRFQNDITLHDGQNQKAVALYHFEQHGSKSFVLGFQKRANTSSDVMLTIDSPVVDSTPINIKVSTDPQAL